MLIISFDFGTKYIGVAIGQQITNTANMLQPIKIYNGLINWHDIKKIIKKWQPIKIIIGLPLNMDGTEQEISFKARKFAQQLEKKFQISIEMHDERMSTIEAKNNLFELGGFKMLKKCKINSLSAVIILESWINSQKK